MILRKKVLVVLIVGVTFLSLGAVVKKKSRIQETQTDPIGYEEKVRQESEGKKGPPVPTLELFPKENFLGEAPVEEFKVGSEIVEQPDEDYSAWYEEEGEIKEEGEEADTFPGVP